MSRDETKQGNIKDHSIHESLHELGEVLKRVKPKKELDSNDAQIIDYITNVQRYAAACLKAVVIEGLADKVHLHKADAMIPGVITAFNAYLQYENKGHLYDALGGIKNFINQLGELSSFNTPPIPKTFTQLQELQQKWHETFFKEKLALLTAEFEESKKRYQVPSEEMDRLLKNNREADQKKLSRAANEEREAAQKVIDESEKKKKETSYLLGVMARIEMASTYKQVAENEKKVADNLRYMGVVLMMVAVLAVGWIIVFEIVFNHGFDWKNVIFKLAIVLVLAAPASYLARESAKHRALQNHNKQRELELAALGPFLEGLPEDTQHEIKADFAKKFFGADGAQNKTDKTDESIALKDLLELLKSVFSKK